MPDTIVAYHADGYGPARPAINVKDRHIGRNYGVEGRDDAISDYIGDAYERITSDFWQAASEIATQRGLGEIEQEGRSGGWLVFTAGHDPETNADRIAEYDPDDPEDAEGLAEARADAIAWLAGYRAMVEWADTWIADAPRKVRDLAQQLAMDEAGEPAALRMFAFGRTA